MAIALEISAQVVGHRIVLRCARYLNAKVRELGATYEPKLNGWILPASTAAQNMVCETFPHLRAKLFDFETVDLKARAHPSRPLTLDDLTFNPAGPTPWDHQLDALDEALRHDAFLFWMWMGTGKSFCAVNWLNAKGSQVNIILCPRRAVGVWPKQFRLHSSRQWTIHPVVKRSPDAKIKEMRQAIELAQVRRQPISLVLNFEAAWRYPVGDYLLSLKPDSVLADELHRAKDASGQLGTWMAGWSAVAPLRLGLTGTLLPHSPLDVFAQYRYLRPDLFGYSYLSFEKQYAIKVDEPFKPTQAEMLAGRFVELESADQRAKLLDAVRALAAKDRQHHEFLRWASVIAREDDMVVRHQQLLEMPRRTFGKIREFQNLDEMNAKIFTCAYYCPKSVLSLPEQVTAPIYCELEGEALATYQKFEADFYAEVEAGTVTADNALTKLVRLHQLSSGHVKLDSGEIVYTSDHKVVMLRDLLEDHASKAVVYCRFTPDLQAVKKVCEALGKKCGELSGSHSDLTDDAEFPEWADVMAVMIQSGGVAVDFTLADLAAYYSVGHNMGDYDQSKERLHRPGQRNNVTNVPIICRNTIEPTIYHSFIKRTNVIEAVLKRRPGDADPDIEEALGQTR